MKKVTIKVNSKYVTKDKAIKKNAFYDSDIVEVVIEDGIKSVGSSAFYRCGWLKKVVLPKSLKKIDDFAFGRCDSLAEIVLPENLETIGAQAFSGCAFSTLEIPPSVREIGAVAVGWCDALETVVIPSGARLGAGCFECDNGLKKVNVPGGVASGIVPRQAFDACHGLMEVKLGEGIVEIGDEAFRKCDHLVKVTLPSTLRKIGDRAFQGCENLSEINFGNDVKDIGDEAFSGCVRLQKIDIPSDCRVGTGAFHGCPGYRVDKSRANIVIKPSTGPYVMRRKGECVIPKEACLGNKDLDSVYIGDGITCIEDLAFGGCDNLRGNCKT